ncbi:sphingolipid delta4-desaturase [Daldinia caldariorum]|uniref:sphingolipid delta4-desaturase n=1 Tax=Daldinia caldariorum TaxID=326644 RepID=UPI0020077E37|nr:sphingolipid delta4-desaturase [Daldinia caldariorum]KAI1466033.1 sphingolipid delta4-desaturase [Daldinia caldariorum]
MAPPSSSSTTTSAPEAPNLQKKTIRLNGKGAEKVQDGSPELKRDPIEVKYRDFFWTYTEEPHRTRRLAIIKAHPEVTKLCGPEPLTIVVVLGVVALQVFCAYVLRDTPFFSLRYWLLAYVVGATANQNLFMAIHEISHNLAFRSPTANRLFAIVANLPIGIPYSASFRPYHLTHHKSLGVDGLDTDLPTALEALFLDSILGKAFFCTFQIFFYAVRPMCVYAVPFTWVSALNVLAQAAFDLAVLRALGPAAMLYFLLSSFLAGSLHPLAGHFIAEHYVYEAVTPAQRDPASRLPVPETYSYYGPLNFLVYNVGLHNEHHDFPAVPWTRLPRLNRLAAEFYDDLPHHRSWTYVLWRFIFDESVGIRCRVKRKEGGRLVGQRSDWKKNELEA